MFISFLLSRVYKIAGKGTNIFLYTQARERVCAIFTIFSSIFTHARGMSLQQGVFRSQMSDVRNQKLEIKNAAVRPTRPERNLLNSRIHASMIRALIIFLLSGLIAVLPPYKNTGFALTKMSKNPCGTKPSKAIKLNKALLPKVKTYKTIFQLSQLLTVYTVVWSGNNASW